MSAGIIVEARTVNIPVPVCSFISNFLFFNRDVRGFAIDLISVLAAFSFRFTDLILFLFKS